MYRLECTARAGYQFNVQWVSKFELPEGVEMEGSMPLRTRDALYGGRIEAMRFNYKVKEGKETIQYVDVMSLYSWVCRYIKFPIGHSTIHVERKDIQAMLTNEGLVRCTVLPYRCDGRLIFSLCTALANQLARYKLAVTDVST
jgi:hypothetical protein